VETLVVPEAENDPLPPDEETPTPRLDD